MLEQLVALAVPPRCAACRAPAAHAADVLCGACVQALPWLRGPCCERCALPLPHGGGGRRCPARAAAFDCAWSAVAFGGAAREALHALKFTGARPLAGLMAAQIAANVPPRLLAGGATLVAVPAHPARRRSRGFDPAALIARALARGTGLPCAAPLRRGAGAARQVGAGRDERLETERLGFFAVADAPRNVVLVDDVHTTGATLHACAQAMRQTGSERIVAITWARTF